MAQLDKINGVWEFCHQRECDIKNEVKLFQIKLKDTEVSFKSQHQKMDQKFKCEDC